ncbi:MAG: type III pantothenate kinase [Paraglaciecola sp.]
MSGKHNALLIDIGNSQIKYTLVNGEVPIAQSPIRVVRCTSVIELAPIIDCCDRVLVSSVGQAEQVDTLTQLCTVHNKPLLMVTTPTHGFGIDCAYEHYQTLGVDRWLAILAGRRLTDKAFAVLDFGTANTCDFVLNDQHLGGWIAPGFSLMRDSVVSNTRHVFANDQFPTDLLVGKQTVDCVNMGCVAATLGFFHAAEQQMSTFTDNYQIIISGGGQALLNKCAPKQCIFHPNLVLCGLMNYLSN